MILFCTSFSSEFAENQKNVIMIQEFPEYVIEAFVTYLKTGNMTTHDLNVEMLKFTHQYDIDFLYEMCSKWLSNTLNKDNIDRITKAAIIFEDQDLLKQVAKFLSNDNQASATMILEALLQRTTLN